VVFLEYDDEHRCAEHEHDSGTLSLSATVTNRASPQGEGFPPSPEEQQKALTGFMAAQAPLRGQGLLSFLLPRGVMQNMTAYFI